MKHAIIVMWLLLALSVSGEAATRYASTSGTGTTCSEGSPCSLATIIGQTAAGDTAILRGGTYATGIDTNIYSVASGTQSQPITYTSYPAETATVPVLRIYSGGQSYIIFDGIFVNHASGSDAAFTVSGSAHHITFKNGDITNPGANCVELFCTTPGCQGFNVFQNSRIHHCDTSNPAPCSGCVGHGLYVGSTDNLFEYLEIDNVGHLAAQTYSEGSNSVHRNVFRFNLIHDNNLYRGILGDSGFSLGSGNDNVAYGNVFYNEMSAITVTSNNPQRTLVYHNTVFDVADGFSVINGTNTEIKNNIVRSASSSSVILFGGTGTVVSGNICAHSVAGCTNTDPSFVSSGTQDFALNAGSAAIGASTAISPCPSGLACTTTPGAFQPFSYTCEVGNVAANIVVATTTALYTPIRPDPSAHADWAAIYNAVAQTETLADVTAANQLQITTSASASNGQSVTLAHTPGATPLTDGIRVGCTISGCTAPKYQRLNAVSAVTCTNNVGGTTPVVTVHHCWQEYLHAAEGSRCAGCYQNAYRDVLAGVRLRCALGVATASIVDTAFALECKKGAGAFARPTSDCTTAGFCLGSDDVLANGEAIANQLDLDGRTYALGRCVEGTASSPAISISTGQQAELMWPLAFNTMLPDTYTCRVIYDTGGVLTYGQQPAFASGVAGYVRR